MKLETNEGGGKRGVGSFGSLSDLMRDKREKWKYLYAIYRFSIDFCFDSSNWQWKVGEDEANVCIRILMNNRLKSVDAS